MIRLVWLTLPFHRSTNICRQALNTLSKLCKQPVPDLSHNHTPNHDQSKTRSFCFPRSSTRYSHSVHDDRTGDNGKLFGRPWCVVASSEINCRERHYSRYCWPCKLCGKLILWKQTLGKDAAPEICLWVVYCKLHIYCLGKHSLFASRKTDTRTHINNRADVSI